MVSQVKEACGWFCYRDAANACLSLGLPLGSPKHGKNKVCSGCFGAHFCPIDSSQPLRDVVSCLDSPGHGSVQKYG